MKPIFDNHVLRDLAHSPVLLSMICAIWKDKSTLPSTISELYHQIIEFLARHWRARESQFASMSFEEITTLVNSILVQIGKTAIHGLLQDSKSTFREEDFSSPEVVDQGYSLGIITKSSSICGLGNRSDIYFVLKTFQEYCAAVYLSSVAKSDNHELFKSYLS